MPMMNVAELMIGEQNDEDHKTNERDSSSLIKRAWTGTHLYEVLFRSIRAIDSVNTMRTSILLAHSTQTYYKNYIKPGASLKAHNQTLRAW